MRKNKNKNINHRSVVRTHKKCKGRFHIYMDEQTRPYGSFRTEWREKSGVNGYRGQEGGGGMVYTWTEKTKKRKTFWSERFKC